MDSYSHVEQTADLPAGCRQPPVGRRLPAGRQQVPGLSRTAVPRPTYQLSTFQNSNFFKKTYARIQHFKISYLFASPRWTPSKFQKNKSKVSQDFDIFQDFWYNLKKILEIVNFSRTFNIFKFQFSSISKFGPNT